MDTLQQGNITDTHTDADQNRASALLDAFQAEAVAAAETQRGRTWYNFDLQKLTTSQAIITSPSHIQIQVLHLALIRIDGLSVYSNLWQVTNGLLKGLFTRRLPFTPNDLQQMLEVAMSGSPAIEGYHWLRYGAFFAEEFDAVVYHAESAGVPAAIRALLVPQIDEIRRNRPDLHRSVNRFKELAGLMREGELEAGEAWADTVMQTVDAMDEAARTHWLTLFALGTRADVGKPTKAWLRAAAARIEAIGHDGFAAQVEAWFPLLTAPVNAALPDRNSLILRGLVWLCAPYDDAVLCRAVSGLAEAMYRKVPGVGLRSRKVATACLATLSIMAGTESVVQLSRLGMHLKGTQVQGDIEKALDSTAQRLGLARAEIEELVVPTYGLNENSVLRQTLGTYTAEITLVGATGVVLRWFDVNDSLLKSAPAAVKKAYAEDLKALKATYDAIRKMLPAQRTRLERLLIEDREWSLTDWRVRYADHPLLAPLVRRLIWRMQLPGAVATLVTFVNGQLVDVYGKAVASLPDDTRVRLWHPITSDAATVLAWRIWLEDRGIIQPFKQAHREVYLLTDAEITTDTYSNRFAAHILRQSQFHALTQQRGWTYQRQGGFDQAYGRMTWRALPWGNVRVQFFVEPAGEEVTESGLYQYLTTDQVRFVDAHGTPRPLIDVPARLFTEAMRDVDLFVGVTSIGNDPTWQNDGDRPFADYWRGYSFGTLTAAAAGRRDILSRLLPRLKIAAQCTLTERFLVVRGMLRTYKIHLGSGNILMEPNDQYLCIVPARGVAEDPAGTRFLPFEGDTMLSLILSKAFLLADDTHIADRTITRQILPGE